MQTMQLEQLHDTMDSKEADVKEVSADYEEKLSSLSSELGKALHRSQQHASTLQLIKQVQVSLSCPTKLEAALNRVEMSASFLN